MSVRCDGWIGDVDSCFYVEIRLVIKLVNNLIEVIIFFMKTI